MTNIHPDAVYEIIPAHGKTHGGRKAQPVNLWYRVPKICGTCPEAYKSTKCKRTSCRIKSMERRGIPAVY